MQRAMFYKSPNPTQPNPTHHGCLAFPLTYVVASSQVKRIFDNLDGMGMLQNTLVVLASDNGGCPSVGGSNYPYRGFKHTLFEGGVRTPAFVYSKSDSIIPLEVCRVKSIVCRFHSNARLEGWRTSAVAMR